MGARFTVGGGGREEGAKRGDDRFGNLKSPNPKTLTGQVFSNPLTYIMNRYEETCEKRGHRRWFLDVFFCPPVSTLVLATPGPRTVGFEHWRFFRPLPLLSSHNPFCANPRPPGFFFSTLSSTSEPFPFPSLEKEIKHRLERKRDQAPILSSSASFFSSRRPFF